MGIPIYINGRIFGWTIDEGEREIVDSRGERPPALYFEQDPDTGIEKITSDPAEVKNFLHLSDVLEEQRRRRAT